MSNSDGHNVTGTAYALTVFTAILPGHEEELRAYIEGLPRGEDAPIARLGIVHTSRLQIFDQLVYQGAPQIRDQLQNKYLVFTAAFDGALDPFLDSILDRIPEAHEWWRHCVGYPGMSDRTAFKRWIRHNKINTGLFAVAYPNETVKAVVDALALRERLVEFAIDAQGLDAAQLQDRFRRTFAKEIG
jgi:hypothetical protein